MEEKAHSTPITDDELLNLIAAARNKDPEATLRLIEMYMPDILRLSKYIPLPVEDVTSEIIVEFLELIHHEKQEPDK